MNELVTMSAPGSLAAEAYRNLRTNFDAMLPENAKVILVTSSAPGEGKDEALANLAVVEAQAGKRVTVVSADYSDSALEQLFGVSAESGLSDALRDPAVLPLHSVPGVHGLRVLGSGPAPERPSDAISGAAMGELLGRLATDSDLVLVTAPPLLASSDAAAAARWCHGVVMCLAAGRSKRSDATRAREMLDLIHVKVIGVILTGVSPREAGLTYFSEGSPA